MRKIFTLFVLGLVLTAQGQVSMRTDKTKVLDEFKATETIFVLSNAYSTSVYEDILKDSWTVTPFKVVKLEDFNPLEYLDGKHSFALLNANSVTTKYTTYLHTYLSVFMFDMEDKLKELEKLKKKSDKSKKDYKIMKDNRITIADFMLYKNEDFISKASITIQEAGDTMYQKNIFHNYSPGLLKNYFQKVNSLIASATPYGLYGGACIPEIKSLKSATLYVPNYVAIKYNAHTGKESDRDDEEKEDLFKDYEYKYEYIDNEALSNKILTGEEFYYLRYVMENAQKYIQVVNSKSGEIVYKNYHPMGYKLKSDHLEEIGKAIEKGKV